jgi:hypothetical protein
MKKLEIEANTKTSWTSEDVRKALGLASKDEAYVKGIQFLCSPQMVAQHGYKEIARMIDERRGTGRTTNYMLIAATNALEGTPTQIRTYDEKREQGLVKLVKGWVEKLGGNPDLVFGRMKKYPGPHEEYWDHV